MPDTDQNFEGLGNVNNVLPPDPNGDVGPDHYVQTVNLSFAIWDKSGQLLYGPANLNTLWQGFGGPCETTNNGDPIVLYDHLADRWLISQFAIPNLFPFGLGPFYQCIAVSQTTDPMGAYFRYEFLISNTKLNDYPKFGVWSDAYYMAVNQFNQLFLDWAGQGVVAFERDRMLQGLPARMVYFDLFSTDPNLGGMLPADMDGPSPPAGAPAPFMQVDDDASGFSPDQLQIWEFFADWADPANSTFQFDRALPTIPFDSNLCGYARNCIPQPGGANVDAISDRLMYRLQYRNFGSHQTLVVNHTVDVNGNDQAGIRWYEVRDSGGGWILYQQGSYSPDETHRWMGSAAMDGFGNLALGFSASSTSVHPSIRYVGRLAGDPLGTLPQGEATLIAGSGYQTHSSGRWGDYSMLAVDPIDDCTYWYTQEYYAVTGSVTWQTRIGSFRFPGCGGPPPPPPPPPPPSATDTPTPSSTPLPTNTPTSTPLPPPRPTDTPTADPTLVPSDTPAPTDTPTESSTPTETPLPPPPPPPPSADTIYLSFTADGTLEGVSFADEDILKHEPAAGTWSLYFDGSDVGLGSTDVDAFSTLPDGSLLISVNSFLYYIPGFGFIGDADIVRFVPNALGSDTAGSFEWYFDGSDVGLTAWAEDIDAIDFAPDGRLLLSTVSYVSVPGAFGSDEDLVAFSPSSLGVSTSGTWSLYFDGSDVGLSTTSDEDIDAVWVHSPTGEIYLSTAGSFAVSGLDGTGADIFICAPGALGPTTSCTFTMYWDAANFGWAGQNTDGIQISRP